MEQKQSNNNLLIAMAVVVLTLIIGVGIFAFQQSEEDSNNDSAQIENNEQPGPPTDNSLPPVENDPTVSELNEDSGDQVFNDASIAQFDGKNGNDCYVAVDGIVYDVTASDLWVNGVHTTSGGRANCGEDLTSVISQSPHGKSVLDRDVAVEVGVFE